MGLFDFSFFSHFILIVPVLVNRDCSVLFSLQWSVLGFRSAAARKETRRERKRRLWQQILKDREERKARQAANDLDNLKLEDDREQSPWVYLPDLVLEMIFQYLPFQVKKPMIAKLFDGCFNLGGSYYYDRKTGLIFIVRWTNSNFPYSTSWTRLSRVRLGAIVWPSDRCGHLSSLTTFPWQCPGSISRARTTRYQRQPGLVSISPSPDVYPLWWIEPLSSHHCVVASSMFSPKLK